MTIFKVEWEVTLKGVHGSRDDVTLQALYTTRHLAEAQVAKLNAAASTLGVEQPGAIIIEEIVNEG